MVQPDLDDPRFIWQGISGPQADSAACRDAVVFNLRQSIGDDRKTSFPSARRVANYVGVDPLKNADDFALGFRIGERLAADVQAELNATSAQAADWFKGISDIVSISCGDRMRQLLRPYIHFRRIAPHGAAVEVHDGQNTRIVVETLNAIGYRAIPCAAVEQAGPAPAKPVQTRTGVAGLRTEQHLSIPILDMPDFKDARPTILAVVRLGDDVFGSGVLPVLNRLIDRLNIFIVNLPNEPSVDLRPFLARHGLKVGDRRWGWVNKFSTEPVGLDHRHPLFASVNTAFTRIGEVGLGFDDPFLDQLCRHVVSRQLLDRYVKLLLQIIALERQIARVGHKLDGVIVSPGRSVESMVFCRRMAEKAKPTFDLQAGTIMATEKFVKPVCDDVLAIDSVSGAIYRDYFKVPGKQVHIVGSPRLDWRVRNFRNIMPAIARARLHLPLDGTMAVFLGQPVQLETAALVLRMLTEGLARSGRPIRLYLRPHPRDSAAHRAQYAAVPQDGFRSVTVAEGGDVYHWMAAADVVLTYCSAGGLEAAALGRPVVSINPLPTPPPVDLTESGAAVEVKSADALAHLIRRGARIGQIDRVMRDGRAADRAAAIIAAGMMRAGSLK